IGASEKPPAMPEDIYLCAAGLRHGMKGSGGDILEPVALTPTYFTESVLCTNRVIRIIFINGSNTKNSR
ncbi:hypothetical protein, partial [Salmonella enterica]